MEGLGTAMKIFGVALATYFKEDLAINQRATTETTKPTPNSIVKNNQTDLA
jgi:hypothetical protein